MCSAAAGWLVKLFSPWHMESHGGRLLISITIKYYAFTDTHEGHATKVFSRLEIECPLLIKKQKQFSLFSPQPVRPF